MYNYVLCFASCLSLHTVNGRCMCTTVVTKSNLHGSNQQRCKSTEHCMCIETIHGLYIIML